MHHIEFDPNPTYKMALLIKTAALRKCDIVEHYIDPISIVPSDIIAFDLDYTSNNKCPVKLIKACLEKLLKALDNLKVETLYVCDAAYFKVLTKSNKAEAHLGYVLDCVMPGYEHMKVILGTNHQSLFYNPLNQEKLDLSLKTLDTHLKGNKVQIGQNIIKSANYPESTVAIAKQLELLHKHPELTCDIEAFSLKFWEAGVGTISFAWDEHNGTSFCCDYAPILIPDLSETPVKHGKFIPNPEVRELLVEFFLTYKGKLTYHNANYDVKVLIYTLFMDDLLDQKGLLNGLEVLANNLDDTKIITYLAINSCARNSLKLKDIAHEFAGNYAQDDIKDITLIPVGILREYNLVDCLATWFVKKKHWPTLIADKQLDVYDTIMKPSIKVIAQMELTGMPLDMQQVHKAKIELSLIRDAFTKNIKASPLIQAYEKKMRFKEFTEVNAGWKKKTEPLSYFDYVVFNPASNPEMQTFLYEHLDFKIIDRTKTKQPAVGAKTLKKLIHKTNDPAIKKLITEFIGLSEASKILSTFIEAFINNSVLKADGIWYLHGSFNLGGTVSGRLSSSGPNLQNIPSGSTYAKIIKECFIAPTGWLMAGADFDALEAKVDALTTKDPNKLGVYIAGMDSHSFNTYTYWPDKMPDIQYSIDLGINCSKLYKVTSDLGKISYHTEDELKQKGLL